MPLSKTPHTFKAFEVPHAQPVGPELLHALSALLHVGATAYRGAAERPPFEPAEPPHLSSGNYIAVQSPVGKPNQSEQPTVRYQPRQ